MRTYLKSLTPLWLYPAISLVVTAFAFLAVQAVMRAIVICRSFIFCQGHICRPSHLAYDSAGFALLSAALAQAQYLLASSLVLSLKDRVSAFSVLFFSASVSGLFFSRIAAGSNFGLSRLCGLLVTAACLLGGLTALFQKESENPMSGLKFNPFRYPKKIN
ncbi:MAG TPA: hypothetical protein DCL44_05035 [Elusimicrobia bacterium]|nr:hypothetical protein [Elusimicrobiota bacterium]